MIIADNWTIIHGVIFASEILSYIFAVRNEKSEDDDDNLAPASA